MKTRYIALITATMMTATACSKDNNDLSTNSGTGNVSSITEQPVSSSFDDGGASEALFSVSEGVQIRFSRGNLQYQASSNTWRFAKNQYDYINNNTDGWTDLFVWDTGGWDVPGIQSHTWRMLTAEDWYYLLENRDDAAAKLGAAYVCNIYGLILLPDNWTLPEGLTFSAGFPSADEVDYNSSNVYNQEQWNVMESSGAIFLPAAGYRYETQVYESGKQGHYWSSSASMLCGQDRSFSLFFDTSNLIVLQSPLQQHFSIRLVTDDSQVSQ